MHIFSNSRVLYPNHHRNSSISSPKQQSNKSQRIKKCLTLLDVATARGGRGGLRSRIADEAAVVLAGEENRSASGQGTVGQRRVSPAADGDDLDPSCARRSLHTQNREREGRCGEWRRQGLGSDGGWVAAMGAGRRWRSDRNPSRHR
jgi:hypothetical protein